MLEATFKEFINDAKWEVKRGNKKAAYIDTPEYILLMGAYNANLLVRYGLYRKKPYSYNDEDKKITITQLEKIRKKGIPVRIKDGIARIEGISFETEKRIPVYTIYSAEEAEKDIADLKEINEYRKDREVDIQTIIQNLSDYIEYVNEEKRIESSLKVNQGYVNTGNRTENLDRTDTVSDVETSSEKQDNTYDI